MVNELHIDLLKVFYKHGVMSEKAVRDATIRYEYFSAIDENPEIDKGKLRQELADKNFLALKTLEGILYGNKKEETIRVKSS